MHTELHKKAQEHLKAADKAHKECMKHHEKACKAMDKADAKKDDKKEYRKEKRVKADEARGGRKANKKLVAERKRKSY